MCSSLTSCAATCDDQAVNATAESLQERGLVPPLQQLADRVIHQQLLDAVPQPPEGRGVAAGVGVFGAKDGLHAVDEGGENVLALRVWRAFSSG